MGRGAADAAVDGAGRLVCRLGPEGWFACAYGQTRDQFRYILDPADVYGPDFRGETFRVLKEKEIARYGEYLTRGLVLETWGRLPPSQIAKRLNYAIHT